MATGTNHEGYHQALSKAWTDSHLPLTDTPVKSSLSEARSKVSFKFFEDIFRTGFRGLQGNRKCLRGFHIYAIDGDQLDLPASTDILSEDYRGYPCSHQRETYYPKMYTAHVVDLINGAVREFCYSSTQDETHQARAIVGSLEKNSISIYDRLHCGYRCFYAHSLAGNYFLVRARSTGNTAPGVIRDFRDSKKRTCTVDWYPPRELRELLPITVRLVKIRNPRSGEDLIVVTNLPKSLFTRKELARLYQRRWEIETSFRDLTYTLKMGQWHSITLNGILQEIFALLWLVNEVRICISQNYNHFFDADYAKSNFKLCFALVMNNLNLLIDSRTKELFSLLEYWIRRTKENRRHLSRSYPRVVKHRGREYTQANLVPRRPLTERH